VFVIHFGNQQCILLLLNLHVNTLHVLLKLDFWTLSIIPDCLNNKIVKKTNTFHKLDLLPSSGKITKGGLFLIKNLLSWVPSQEIHVEVFVVSQKNVALQVFLCIQ
jgi:hypothetical protein